MNIASKTGPGEKRPRPAGALWLIPILLIAFFMRVHDIGHTPLGLHYDEAANVILSTEIAGGAHPIFIKGYTGKEVLFFYLASTLVRLIGHPLIAVRLASAMIGLVSVAVTFKMTAELFDDPARRNTTRALVTALIAAALHAVNLWAITTSRLGFRALTQPLFQSLTMLFIFRGLHRSRWRDWILGGLFCGLSAYTYLAVRAFPLLLAPLFLWTLLASPGRRQRGKQIALLTLIAAVVVAPLGLFYLHNPQFFGNRMSQVAVFSPDRAGWAAFRHAAGVSLAMFTIRGDQNWRFNVAGSPALWWPVGVFFYLGLLFGLIELGRAFTRRPSTPTPYLTLLLWLPIMLLPSILGGQDVEISLSLRAIGTLPALFIWPALGMSQSTAYLTALFGKRARQLGRSLTALALVSTGVYAYIQCFHVWGPSPENYAAASGYLTDAADFLNRALPPGAACYVAAEHYRHPTLALTAHDYANFKWLIGPDVFVFPGDAVHETWYVFTREAMPSDDMLLRMFGSLGQEHRSPDGQTAFRVYRLPPGRILPPHPQRRSNINLGNTLRFVGHDINQPATSGAFFDVTLYFQVLRQVDRDDYAFFAHLIDDAGFQWGGDTFFTYPSAQWATGETIAFRFTSRIWSGAPPGQYDLAVGVYSPSLDARLPVLNAAGQMTGTAIPVGPIDVAHAPTLPTEQPEIAHPINASFGPSLDLLGADRVPERLRPGEQLNLSLYWQSTAKLDDGIVALWLENAQTRIDLWHGHPVRGRYPFAQWQTHDLVRDRYALRLPIDMPEGDFDLQVAVPGIQGSRAVSLGVIHIEASERLWEAPELEHTVGANLGRVMLLGYNLDPTEVAPGETVHLTLVWQCLEEMDTAYTVFTHLLDRHEQIRGQRDNPPRRGRYPTTLWAKGEIVVDEYDIVVQADSPPGQHAIEVGMYDPGTLERLPVRDPSGAMGNRVLLGAVTVTFSAKRE